jgi:hypothetical protein
VLFKGFWAIIEVFSTFSGSGDAESWFLGGIGAIIEVFLEFLRVRKPRIVVFRGVGVQN